MKKAATSVNSASLSQDSKSEAFYMLESPKHTQLISKIIEEGSRADLVELIHLLVHKNAALGKRLRENKETLKITKELNERTLLAKEAELQDIMKEKVLESKMQLRQECVKQIGQFSQAVRKIEWSPLGKSTDNRESLLEKELAKALKENEELRELAASSSKQGLCSRCKAYIQLTDTLEQKLSKLKL